MEFGKFMDTYCLISRASKYSLRLVFMKCPKFNSSIFHVMEWYFLYVTVKYDTIVTGDNMRTRGTIHCNLKELAERDKLSQADIMRITMASSRQQVSRWFNNKDIPHALYLLRIKKATGWKLEDMITEEENEMSSLGEALPKEIERVQELIKDYESVPMGHIAATLMKQDIKKAHDAMMSGDLPGMLAAYEELKGYE